jgi:hypothetical protein
VRPPKTTQWRNINAGYQLIAVQLLVQRCQASFKLITACALYHQMAGASVMQRALWLLCGLAISIKGTQSMLAKVAQYRPSALAFWPNACLRHHGTMQASCCHRWERIECMAGGHLMCHVDTPQEGMPHPVLQHT